MSNSSGAGATRPRGFLPARVDDHHHGPTGAPSYPSVRKSMFPVKRTKGVGADASRPVSRPADELDRMGRGLFTSGSVRWDHVRDGPSESSGGPRKSRSHAVAYSDPEGRT
jgi:hypothetical protein